MSFLESERKRLVEIRGEVFGDPGGGLYRNKERAFVLRDSLLNLWEGIRQDTPEYFARNQIVWWGDRDNQPTGHLLSSQIACLNHLFSLRHSEAASSAILRNIHPGIESTVIVDDGFVEFEAVGSQNYLGERSHTRGANATSIDAIMVGKKANGKNILVMIEWKYTEAYRPDNKYIPARARIYDLLLADPDCPIKVERFEDVYYEPFYQLMRQTLLGWKMVQNHEYGCDEYVHLHVIPANNEDLKNRVTSPGLTGETMSGAWKNVLREPDRYRVVSPDEFLAPLADFDETKMLHVYLSKRYWKLQPT